MYYTGICLEKLRKTTKNLRTARLRGQDLNPGPPEYEGVLTTRPRHSAVNEGKRGLSDFGG
jgi:hypothetical protein